MKGKKQPAKKKQSKNLFLTLKNKDFANANAKLTMDKSMLGLKEVPFI